MLTNLKAVGILVALACLVAASMTSSASAMTVEVAKKCIALTDKAFPPRVVGNPAAGSANGSAKSEQRYFNKCVANGGKVDDRPAKNQK